MKIETLKDGNNGVHYPSVQLDIHIAKELYIELSQIRDTVKNNKDSFQEYDCFQLTDDEFNELKTLDESREHPIFYPSIFANYNSNFNPLAFTENGLNKLLEILKLNDRTPVIHGSSQQLFYIYRCNATGKEYVLYDEIKKLNFVHPSEYLMNADDFEKADKLKDFPSVDEFRTLLEFNELPWYFHHDKMVYFLMKEIEDKILFQLKETEDRKIYFTRLILDIEKAYNHLISRLKASGKSFQNIDFYNHENVKEIARIGGVDVDDKKTENIIDNTINNFEKEQSEILWNIFLLCKFIEELQKFTDSKEIDINLVEISESQHVEYIFAGIKTEKKYLKTNTITLPEQTTGEPKCFTRTFTTNEQKKLFENLTESDFLPKETIYSHFCYVFGKTSIPNTEKPFEPLQWIKKNGTVKVTPNKKSLLDLLTILGISEKEIKEKINQIFTVKNGVKFKSNNYKYSKGTLNTKSEYHSILSNIVNKSKEK